MAALTTILLVDDDEDILPFVQEGMLSYDRKYVVDRVRDASECLGYIGQNLPDLILMNVKLPDMDGFALRDKLKMTDAKDVPVIYLTAEYDMGMTRKVGMLSADDFIAKPISLPELILRIQKAMMWGCFGRSRRNRR
jgi:DNA-binding response OmpR family regulator